MAAMAACCSSSSSLLGPLPLLWSGAAIDSAEVTRSRRGHISIKVDRQVRKTSVSYKGRVCVMPSMPCNVLCSGL